LNDICLLLSSSRRCSDSLIPFRMDPGACRWYRFGPRQRIYVVERLPIVCFPSVGRVLEQSLVWPYFVMPGNRREDLEIRGINPDRSSTNQIRSCFSSLSFCLPSLLCSRPLWIGSDHTGTGASPRIRRKLLGQIDLQFG